MHEPLESTHCNTQTGIRAPTCHPGTQELKARESEIQDHSLLCRGRLGPPWDVGNHVKETQEEERTGLGKEDIKFPAVIKHNTFCDTLRY